MLATASNDAARAEESGWSALGRKRTCRHQATRQRVLAPALDPKRTYTAHKAIAGGQGHCPNALDALSAEAHATACALSHTSVSTMVVKSQPWLAGKPVCSSAETRVQAGLGL